MPRDNNNQNLRTLLDNILLSDKSNNSHMLNNFPLGFNLRQVANVLGNNNPNNAYNNAPDGINVAAPILNYNALPRRGLVSQNKLQM